MIRWGVIGVGRFGMVHAQVLQSLAGVELAGLCTRNPHHRDSAVEAFGETPVFSEHREMLSQAKVDAVSITN